MRKSIHSAVRRVTDVLVVEPVVELSALNAVRPPVGGSLGRAEHRSEGEEGGRKEHRVGTGERREEICRRGGA